MGLADAAQVLYQLGSQGSIQGSLPATSEWMREEPRTLGPEPITPEGLAGLHSYSHTAPQLLLVSDGTLRPLGDSFRGREFPRAEIGLEVTERYKHWSQVTQQRVNGTRFKVSSLMLDTWPGKGWRPRTPICLFTLLSLTACPVPGTKWMMLLND